METKTATMAPDPFWGATLKGRYAITGELGRGGFGIAYLAHDLLLHSRPVVVKMMWEQTAEPDRARKRFGQEIEAMARIDHPGVVTVLDAGFTADHRPFLVMQYVDGVNLRSAMSGQGMDLEKAGRIMEQVGRALDAAHQKGVYHRDLKPENIMLQRLAGDEEQVKLIDFGIAALHDVRTDLASRGTEVAGTPAYMAPEQLVGRVTQASDVFAMGVVAYEMVTGRRPFEADTVVALYAMQRAGAAPSPKQLRPALPEAAEGAILKALAFDPAKRFQHPAEFGIALARAFQGIHLARKQPNLGWLVAKMCNRRSQEDEFKLYFLSEVADHPGVPQVYVIHGDEGESHESLVERLAYHVEALAPRRTAEPGGTVIRSKIPWQYDGPAVVRRDRLTARLIEQLSPTSEVGLSELTPARLRAVLERSPADFVIVQHDIRTARWDSQTAPLLRDYSAFWHSVGPGSPQVLVFLNVIYPRAHAGRWWERFRKRKITGQLREIARQASGLCLVLEELRPISRDDVMEWFSLHNIYDSEEIRSRNSDKIFPTDSDRKPMAEVELHLKNIHREFVAEGGYL